MPSRRRALAILGAAAGGCLGDGPRAGGPAGRDSPAGGPGATDAATTTPAGWPPPAWEPAWRVRTDRSHVLGLDSTPDGLYVLASDQRGPTTLARYDTAARSVRWQTRLDGAALEHSHLDSGHLAHAWGVTLAEGLALVVTGRPGEHWSTLHAVDRETGRVRWRLRRDRRLAVRGLVDGVLTVVARAFEGTEPEGTPVTGPTPTPEPRPAAVLSVDSADGAVRWTRSFSGVGAVAADRTGVYAGVMDELVALSETGDERWRVPAGARASGIFPSGKGVRSVARPAWNRSVVRGFAPDGTARWSETFGADTVVPADGGLLLAGSGVWLLHQDGSVAWQRDSNAARPVFSPDGEQVSLRLGADGDVVGSVSVADGNENWRFAPPIGNAWPEAAAAGTLVVGGIGDGKAPLYRVDAATGVATARRRRGESVTVEAGRDRVFVGTEDYESGGAVLALPLA